MREKQILPLVVIALVAALVSVVAMWSLDRSRQGGGSDQRRCAVLMRLLSGSWSRPGQKGCLGWVPPPKTSREE